VERIWRVRKNHIWIDAQLVSPSADGDGRPHRAAPPFTLQFFYDGTLVFTRPWSTREQALEQAARTLTELQRAGWNSHW